MTQASPSSSTPVLTEGTEDDVRRFIDVSELVGELSE
jgi:hypothetical protein